MCIVSGANNYFLCLFLVDILSRLLWILTVLRLVQGRVKIGFSGNLQHVLEISLPVQLYRLSYSMVVLYIGIIKVRGFLPKNPTNKSTKYLLSDSMAALVRHSQAQKCLQINSKPLH